MKKITVLLSSLLVLLFFVSCEQQTAKENEHAEKTVEHAKGEAHWSYEGETAPEHWAEILKDSQCDGKYQSPIDINEEDTRPAGEYASKPEYFYSPETVIYDVVNNGHSIQYDFHPGDSMIYLGKTFHLKQVHFHVPSEHTINGMRFAMEIHLVHLSDQNEFAVVGILGKQGPANERYAFFGEFLPLKTGETKDINRPFDLKQVFPENTDEYFTYTGSLTTPPCTEGVNWIIYRNPIILSHDQVTKLEHDMPLNNFRNEQPLNGRTVYRSF